MPKPLTVWITINCAKYWKRWEYQTTCPASWDVWMQVRKQQNWTGRTDWFQIGKGVCRGYILSPCLFNFYAEYIMRNAGLEKAQSGIKIAGRNINNLRYANDTTLMAESEELKSVLMKVKEVSEKVSLKLNMQKTRIMASSTISSFQFSSIQSLSCVWIFATPWTTACQAYLSINNSRSLLKLMSIKSVMPIQPSHPLSSPSPPAPNPSQHQGLFQWGSFHQGLFQLFAWGGQSIGVSALA